MILSDRYTPRRAIGPTEGHYSPTRIPYPEQHPASSPPDMPNHPSKPTSGDKFLEIRRVPAVPRTLGTLENPAREPESRRQSASRENFPHLAFRPTFCVVETQRTGLDLDLW